jgi:hypothetical protein
MQHPVCHDRHDTEPLVLLNNMANAGVSNLLSKHARAADCTVQPHQASLLLNMLYVMRHGDDDPNP